MPVTIHSWQLNKDTMSGWLDTLEGAGLNMVYTDSQGQQVKREDPGFRIINMLGAGDAADEDNMLRLMRETALKSTSNGEGRIDVANALVSTGIALATTYNIGTDMDMLTMKIVPTADPTVFRGIFLAGINNMIDDNVTGIDPDTSQKDDLDYMPGFADEEHRLHGRFWLGHRREKPHGKRPEATEEPRHHPEQREQHLLHAQGWL